MAKQAVTVELFYAGVWNVHTGATLTRDQIEITRGRADESGQPAPAKATLTFTGWRFNPRNPASDLFGLIGRNTPIRITVGTSVRFIGEVASWTPRQSLGGPNRPPDRWVDVVAAGISRRLGQGADPLHDTLRRFVAANPAELVGYWPLSDVDGSTSAASVIRGGRMRLSTEPELVGLGLTSLPSFGSRLVPWLPTGIETREDGALEAQVSGATAPVFAIDWVYRATRASDGNLPLTMLINAVTNGPDGQQNFQVIIDPGLLPRVVVIDGDGGTLGTVLGDAHPEIFDGQARHMRLHVFDTTGNNVVVRLDLDGAQILGGFVDIEQAALDPLGKVVLFWDAAALGVLPVRMGQVIAWNDPPEIEDAYDAYLGHVGEHAGRRIERLCDEEGVPFAADGGDLDDTQPAGPQYPDGFLALQREHADLDHGIVTDSRADRALAYRTGRALYNQDAALALDYDAGQVAPPLDPVLDDQTTRNDITVERRDGDSVRVTLDTGPMSTETPPAGVGRAQESVTVNTMGDGLLGDHAGWRLHLGTSDPIRFPQITVDLDATPALVAAVDPVDVGDRVTVANLPPDLTPDLASLIVQGYTETVGSHRRRITYNCTPEEPFHIAEVEHPEYSIIGPVDSRVIATFVSGTDTALSVSADSSGGTDQWTEDPGEVPLDIIAAGVRLRVTAVGPVISFAQTLTVDQAPINGVIKTIPTTTPVDVFHKSYIGL